ncbi:MAG: GIY-YIG nuclease family protein [Prolixibacteraceae bacterium]
MLFKKTQLNDPQHSKLIQDKSYYLYLIESIPDGIPYVGMATDPEKRLFEHNQGKSKFTCGHVPWRIIYVEFAGNTIEARAMEKYYKSAPGRRKIAKLFPKQ